MKIKAFYLLFFVIFIFGVTAYAENTGEVSVTDIKWNEKERMLTYNLSGDAVVKIRVGLYAGPLYRTIVDLEKKPKGLNQETWDGKDEDGRVDFLKYGKPHFCVDSPVMPRPDSVLNVKFGKGVETGNLIKIDEPNEITIDVPDNTREVFNKNGAELRLYVDNKLKKIEKVSSLPYVFSLDTAGIDEGEHLLTMNLWLLPDFQSVSYKSFGVLLIKKKAGIPSGKSEKTAKTATAAPGTATGTLAFSMRDKDGFWQIYTCALDGTQTRQLTTSLVDKRYPSWSPDGKKIAYVNNMGELWLVDYNGANNRKIDMVVTCSEPKFSPDGKKIIFTALEDVYHGNTKIWEVDLETFQAVKLLNRPWLQYNPSYSPDGNDVIFTEGPELFGQDIRKLNLKTRDVTQLTDNGPYDYDMQASFLKSGQEIVYSSNEGAASYQIYKMDKFGRGRTNLSRNSASYDTMPHPSEDGDNIYFLSDRSGKVNIWKMNMDGSNPEQVTKNDADITSFSVYME
ncbi:MAG: hypothetical protein PHV48_04570 [Candidatus Omnitrophica bacterium]|nr:hypothetical protein [Candidatus Omnitrophota bacterium]